MNTATSNTTEPVPMPDENITGHLGRVKWMTKHLRPDDRVVEVGCGTGYRITFVLKRWGYDVVGVDIDEASIRYGQRVLEQAGLDRDLIAYKDVRETDGPFDVAILSEVLEHLTDEQGLELLTAVKEKLAPGGRVLVTVPNGYGWYEGEAWLWRRTGIGFLLERTKIAAVLRRIKQVLVSGQAFEPIATSLATSPHLQRFTLASIQERLVQAGFEPVDRTGSVFFCGPLTDLLFTGARRVQDFNRRLGRRFPRVASGFYLAAVAREPQSSIAQSSAEPQRRAAG